jgi:hypothetical protein
VTRFGFVPWNPDFAAYLVDGVPDRDILVIANGAQFLPEMR